MASIIDNRKKTMLESLKNSLNALVYSIYGLTDEEIALVEEAVK